MDVQVSPSTVSKHSILKLDAIDKLHKQQRTAHRYRENEPQLVTIAKKDQTQHVTKHGAFNRSRCGRRSKPVLTDLLHD